jgi:hypothetical protein
VRSPHFLSGCQLAALLVGTGQHRICLRHAGCPHQWQRTRPHGSARRMRVRAPHAPAMEYRSPRAPERRSGRRPPCERSDPERRRVGTPSPRRVVRDAQSQRAAATTKQENGCVAQALSYDVWLTSITGNSTAHGLQHRQVRRYHRRRLRHRPRPGAAVEPGGLRPLPQRRRQRWPDRDRSKP